MYCRVVRTKLDPNRIDESIKGWNETMAPTIKKQPGFAGYATGVNRKTGDGLTVTYWETEKAMQDARQPVMAVADKFLQAIGGERLSQDDCEVAVMERFQPPKVGVAVRWNTLKADPSKINGGIADFKEKVVPVLKQQKGSRTAVFFVDRKTGKSFAGSVWDTQQDLEKSESAISSLRKETAARAGASDPKVEIFEVVSTEILTKAPASR
jgi:heme-degrading monooxygenase HmoA